ncbi:hypothetical protein [Streptomyces sp. YIM 98790]|uniref:hypothetical protein n=1 Tax=Streptomyces sp. YIM 98790 TaxID=2689077 RepID=UPI001A9D8320|nr:hypothetical protein [Streptomyces sp. YIM 98790]
MTRDEAISQPAPVPAYRAVVGDEPLTGPVRNSVGGWPYLDAGQEWPQCFCGLDLVLYFQFDIPADVEFFGGTHLLVFHCRAHNDAASPELRDGRLVPRYWQAPQPPYPGTFWRILLQDNPSPTDRPEPHLQPRPLTLTPFTDHPLPWGDEEFVGAQEFKVGGIPSWAQGPESYRCACGADLVYLCQVPEDMPFTTRPGSPEQPYGSTDEYCLFLGNEVYLLAYPARCHPAATWPVNQK